MIMIADDNHNHDSDSDGDNNYYDKKIDKKYDINFYILALNTGECLAIRGPSSSYCFLVWHTL